MTYPKTILTAWNLTAKKEYGQNFLKDPSTAGMIVEKSKIHGSDTVLEIGAGLGALTIPLARKAKKVYAIEKDKRITPLLKTELVAAKLSNVDILEKNILYFDMDELSREAGVPLVVMGNLPYNISSQILVRLIKSRPYVRKAVLMFQHEMARRISAGPNSRDYGRLSVMLRYCADVKSLAKIEAKLFFPKPKIDSEVLAIFFKESPDFPADDEDFLFRVIKAAFGKRRKTLKNALSGSDLEIDGKTAQKALEEAEIDPKRRAETLEVEEFVRLSNCLGNIMAHLPS